jgi:hypothetical protein
MKITTERKQSIAMATSKEENVKEYQKMKDKISGVMV